ncbi:hypothetical protein VNO78_10480 [Psophocarpus tetragonolobus]|uniref:Uncharacterized protein n=1 Tax=Psophocarpus tetragonolobus TaxID=3891 RepID=A0AAN9SJW0_PSOTE
MQTSKAIEVIWHDSTQKSEKQTGGRRLKDYWIENQPKSVRGSNSCYSSPYGKDELEFDGDPSTYVCFWSGYICLSTREIRNHPLSFIPSQVMEKEESEDEDDNKVQLLNIMLLSF